MYRSVYIESVIKKKQKQNQNMLLNFQSVCLPEISPSDTNNKNAYWKLKRQKKMKAGLPQ